MVNKRALLISFLLFTTGIIVALCINSFYYSRFRYEINMATITSIVLLCEIGNKTIDGFICPKPLYYKSYQDAMIEMNRAYTIIVPIDITMMVLILFVVLILIWGKISKSLVSDYIEIR